MSQERRCPRCRTRYGVDIAYCPYDGTLLRAEHREDALIGRTLAGRYRIDARLGTGGMGSVYLAEHLGLRRKCALKVISESYASDTDAVARFCREAENASGIMHPNVATVFDFGDAGGRLLFLAMEYVPGEPLSALLARTRRLAPRRATGIAWQVADALTAAHDLGIVHRDLKPENVMLARHRDGSDFAKVVDFGVARVMHSVDQRVTRTGIVVGTQEYMSPEQLCGDPVDGRSDLYALGLLVFRLLTGGLPFDAPTSQEALLARVTGRPRPLREACPDVAWPEPLQHVLDIALAADPRQRYQNASELGTDLVSAVLEWLPDNEHAADPWEVRIRYQTPVALPSVRNRSQAADSSVASEAGPVT